MPACRAAACGTRRPRSFLFISFFTSSIVVYAARLILAAAATAHLRNATATGRAFLCVVCCRGERVLLQFVLVCALFGVLVVVHAADGANPYCDRKKNSRRACQCQRCEQPNATEHRTPSASFRSLRRETKFLSMYEVYSSAWWHDFCTCVYRIAASRTTRPTSSPG